MDKKAISDSEADSDTMELEEFVRSSLQAIIRGMRNLGDEGCVAEGLAVKGQEARVDFRLSLETLKNGKICVAKIDGRASPNSNRIEFSIKLGRDPARTFIT